MGGFVKGEIVVLPFPFSDLSSSKKRPALVIAQLRGSDVILCQITSKAKTDGYSILLSTDDFAHGGLSKPSNIRPNRLFTADQNIILQCAGRITKEKMEQVIKKLIQIIQA